MTERDTKRKKIEPQPNEEPPERTSAPPIEREHETYEGIFEEDEKREQHAGRANDVY